MDFGVFSPIYLAPTDNKMTQKDFEKRINALAVRLGASVKLNKVGKAITSATFMVGRKEAFFLTYDSFFDRIEACDDEVYDLPITPEGLDVYVVAHYYVSLGKHFDAVEKEMAKYC